MTKLFFSTLLATLLLTSLVLAEPSGQADADKGVQLYKQRRYAEAVQQLRSALGAGVDPAKESNLWTILGNAYDELDQYSEAIEAHKRALEIDPKSSVVWTNLGAVYRHDQNFTEARNCYLKALDLNPDYPEAHASLGALYIFENQPDKAIDSLQRALELDSSLPVTHANIAVAYAKVGRFAEAQAALDKATSMGYRNTATIQNLIDQEKAR